MAELFEWKCSECGKEISSTHKGQFDYNKKLHIDSHKKDDSSSSGDGSIKNDNIPTKKVDEEGRIK